ncbi:MAG: Transposase DDE domain protein [Syntrophaceae bacterium PtaU1.Bin231]|nr:MAG: Transposase DDE domain protein [Syntrophaceae bacterium PtaU1.Bin231]
MYSGPLVFTQVMDFMPLKTFQRCVARYQGNFSVKHFSCLEQFRIMAFAQLTYRESLRDIEACLRAQNSKLYHMGIRSKVSRSTLAEANEMRDWRIYADFAHHLIAIARKLYQKEPLAVELQNTVYALDATTIDLCLSLFPWARFRAAKGAVRLHTLLDLRGNIPSFIHISDGKLHEVNALDLISLEAGAFYIMDRGYTDFSRLHAVTQASAFFVIRAKSNLKCRRLYSHPVDKSTDIVCDQSILLTVAKSAGDYPDKLRRVRYYDAETDKNLVFLTNNFLLPAITIAQLYKQRWQVELFFKWIKQHLRIKSFFGTSETAVKTQIWIAISVYLIVAIIKKRLNLQNSLYTILQVLSVSLFERTSMFQLLTFYDYTNDTGENHNQLNLFTDYSGQ